MANLKEIEKKTVPVDEYVKKVPSPFNKKFSERKQSYQLDEEVVQKLKSYTRDVVIVVFSAQWCKDCAANVPILALIAERTNIKVRVFGGLKRVSTSRKRPLYSYMTR